LFIKIKISQMLSLAEKYKLKKCINYTNVLWKGYYIIVYSKIMNILKVLWSGGAELKYA